MIPRGDFLILEILRFAHEVKEAPGSEALSEASSVKPKFSAKELRMAEDLIEEMSVKWDPEHYKDSSEENLRARIEQKLKHPEEALAAPAQEEEESLELAETSSTRDVVDLLPLLQKSLESRKPGKSRGKARHEPTSKVH